MTPTKTGAARAIDRVLPELAGRVVGIAVRVPIPDVSLVDLSATLERPATAESVNQGFREAAAGPLGAVLGATDEPLVSVDFHGDSRSAVIDLPSTRGGPGNTVKVLAWYDNEAGYAARVVDLCRLLGGTVAPGGLVPAIPVDAVTPDARPAVEPAVAGRNSR
jgi:glyceraldehyde 3-phosphate dehydrogenase